jgi:cation transport ATPase
MMSDQTPDASKSVRTFVKELFEIIEWAIVVAAIQVVGKKLELPVAQLIGLLLFVVLSFYVGMRIYDLSMWARFRGGPRTHDFSGFIFSFAVAASFGLGLSLLIQALTKVNLGS